MIGSGIGIQAIGASAQLLSPPNVFIPNIFLTGTLDYVSSYRTLNRVSTFLNFTAITNDDNVIQVNLYNNITGLPVQMATAEVSVYAPNTVTDPVVVKENSDIVIGAGFFQFPLLYADVQNLAPGLYAWVAIVTLTDGSRHTVNSGDICLSTGVITVVKRPS